MKKQKIPFDILDSIRGIAALYVAVAHCRGVLWMGGTEYSRLFPRASWDVMDYLIVGSSMLTRMAVEFVIVFFVLSGFSIAHSLTSDKSALPFYKRRFVRIYPSYIMALVWAGVIFLLTKAMFPQWYDGTYTSFAFLRTMEMNSYFDAKEVVSNVFYMPGKGFVTPFWSLTYEVIFYLLAPFLMRRVDLYCGISLLLFLVKLVLPQQIESLHIPVYISEFLFTYNIYFAMGVAFYRNFDGVMAFFQQVKKWLHGLVLVIVLAGMYAANIYYGGETTINFVLASVFSVLLMVYFLKNQVRIKWLMHVGHYSYTLYITHFASVYLYLAIYWWVSGHRQPYITEYWVWIPAVFFCLLIGWIQYQLIEKRTKEILNSLRKQRVAKTA